MNRRSSLLLRAAVAAVLFLSLGGPTPGVIGGCDGSTQSVSAMDYCRQVLTRICQREAAAGQLDQTQLGTCVGRVEPICGSTTSATCAPTVQQATACYDALESGDPTIFNIRIVTDPLLIQNADLLPECAAACAM